MTNRNQILPFLLARSPGLLLTGRVLFPQKRIGEVVREEEGVVIVPTGHCGSLR